MDRWVGCAKSFQTNLIWPSPVPYNGRYSVRPERKEEQEAADLHLFWVRPESEKDDQKLTETEGRCVQGFEGGKNDRNSIYSNRSRPLSLQS